MTQTVLTIIGMGPRGISVLERIAHHVRSESLNQKLVVNLVDPGECGQGTHSARQPHHLLTNTLANQVTIFPPDTAATHADRLSFGEWARMAGYRKFGSACYPTGETAGEEINDQHYLPRHLLGQYFTWAFDRIAESLPCNVELVHLRHRAVGIERSADNRQVVHLNGGLKVESDFVILTTGHGKRSKDKDDLRFEDFVQSSSFKNSNLAFFPHAYPIDQLERVSPDATVAIQGFGLTAHDVLSHLTTGRGGAFVENQAGLEYRKSGREPRILMYSRKSLPFSGRAINQKSVDGRYQARFFTVEAVAELRNRSLMTRGTPQIDFVGEILPLVKKDMARARRTALDGQSPGDAEWSPDAADLTAIDKILDPLHDASFDGFQAFETFFRDFLLDDLAEIDKGNVHGPVKAATDVLRDLRETFRLAAEYTGFTAESHKVFAGEFVQTLNRIVFGPPRHRNAELVALLNAGVVELAGGPRATTNVDPASAKFVIDTRFGETVERRSADVLVLSRIDVFSPLNDGSALMQNLLQSGSIRPYYNGEYHPGGIDIDQNNNVLDRDGRSQPDFWAIGYLVEGPHYYTQELPRPGRYSRLTRDADVCISRLFELIYSQAASSNDAPTQPAEDERLLDAAYK